jgi:hypothetical protein
MALETQGEIGFGNAHSQLPRWHSLWRALHGTVSQREMRARKCQEIPLLKKA